MVFEYILKQNNIDPAADLSIDQSIDFGSTAAAFSGGMGEFTVEFNLLLPHYPNYRIAYVYSGETITRRCFLLSMGRRFQQPAAGIT